MEEVLYRCGICLDGVEEPRALPCLHSFCTSCLCNLCDAEQFRCPECRKPFALPVGGVEDFPVNFYLKPALTNRQDPFLTSESCFLCSVCQECPVVSINVKSGQLYCCKCTPDETDEVVLIEDSYSQVEALSCACHPEAILDGYCSECRVLACHKCLQHDHRDHQQVNINRVSNKMRTDIRTALNDGQKERIELLVLAESMALREEQMRQSQASALSAVNETFARIEKVLTLYKQCILREVESMYERDAMIAEEGKKEALKLTEELDDMFLRTASVLSGPSVVALAKSSILNDLKQVFVKCDQVRGTLVRNHSQEQDKPCFPTAHQLNAMTSTLQKRVIDAVLSPAQPYPPNCKLTQPNSMPLLPRKDYVAVLTCYNGWMTPATVSQNQLSIQLYSEEGLQGTTILEQKENTVAITFSLPTSGVYQLSVKINGANVEGSPATLYSQRSCTGVSKLSHVLHASSGPSQYTNVAVSRDGDIAASNMTLGTIDLFDNRGLYTKSIKSDRLGSPGGLCVDPFGNIIVIDTEKKCVRKFTRGGQYVGKIGTYGPKNGQMIQPIDVATSHDGSIYIIDSARDRIFVYSEAGVLKKEIGGYGSGPLHFRMPTSIVFSEDNRILVADHGNRRIQVLSPDGEFLSFFGKNSYDQEKITSPYRLSIAKDGIVIVTERELSVAAMFTDKGEFICSHTFPHISTPAQEIPISIVANGNHELLISSTGYSGITVYS